jgi:REP element-mobilizing transposase RayT
MPRKPRIEFPGAFYHVISRGNKKENIFFESAGKKRFRDKLLEYRNRYKFIIYAYVFMDNHIHLLIESGDVSLSKIMQGLLQSQTQWHNKKYRTVGHLFQGRYKAILCDKDAYLIALICYIHVNPVRAGLVEDPADFAWSSHRSYLGLEKSEIVDVEFILGQLSKNRSEALHMYENLVRDYMNRGKMDEFYGLRDKRILGNEEFYDGVMQKVSQNVGNLDRILRDKELKDIARAISVLTGITPHELQGSKREPRIIRARALFIRLAMLFTESKKKDISAYLHRKPGSLTYIERQIKDEDLWGNIRKLKW